jgi:hypothetical protein
MKVLSEIVENLGTVLLRFAKYAKVINIPGMLTSSAFKKTIDIRQTKLRQKNAC